MREIDAADIRDAVAELCLQANYELPEDALAALRRARESEESPRGREVLETLLENAELARRERLPICQDTGFAVVFLRLGQEVHVRGSLAEAVAEGVRRGYRDGYLRTSIVASPLDRRNTGDNTPPVLHVELVDGDEVEILVAPKGAGCENMSALRMLPPAAGEDGVKDFVVETVRAAGPNPCPPTVVGVGLGGTFERCACLAKKALFRPIGEPNPDPAAAALERELTERCNRTGVGPMGLGGRNTVLAVHVETFPCHIASLPVAVNINCHASRHARRRL